MTFRTRAFWQMILDLLALAGLLAIAFAASPSHAVVTACIEDEDGNRLRRVYVAHWLTDYRTNANGCVTIAADGPIDIRVFAQNPVIRMDDGSNFATPVSQEIRGVRNGETVAIGAQSQWFQTAEIFRDAYDNGLRNLPPWNGAEFPAAVVRNPFVGDYLGGAGVIRSVWPDRGLSVRAWVEGAAPVVSGDFALTEFPLVHLKESRTDAAGNVQPGNENNRSTIAHELGHALHFARIGQPTRAALEGLYGLFLATDEARSHCFERRTDPTVAWIEAFGAFADDFDASNADEQAFFDLAISQRDNLLSPRPACEDRESGPMFGADVEGAIYLTLFHDFARQPGVGLDFVVETYVNCESLDFAGYAQCLRNRHGAGSAIYKALVRAAGCYGISIDGSVAEVAGVAEFADTFGRTVASGDFNGDGFADVAIGKPFEDAGTTDAAGAVNVLYGLPSGLAAACSAEIVQGAAGLPDTAEAGDHFGATLATGDFDADGFDDLAIAAPDETVNSVELTGLVIVVPGSQRGLEPDRAVDWHLDKTGVLGTAGTNDGFGLALAAGDFDGNDVADLAIGVPDANVPATAKTAAISNAGSVHVFYGVAGVGITATNDQRLLQPETAEASDRFGRALATGDFDGDGRDDLAVGAPGERVGTINGAGAVSLFYGGATLSAAASRHWTQETSGINGVASFGEGFGETLATGDFDANGKADLAIGVPSDKIGTIDYAGGVAVLYGNASRTATPRNDLWTQDTGTVQDVAEASDHFGTSLVTGDFDADGRDDLAIGVPDEDVGSVADAGSVAVLYGAPTHTESTSALVNGSWVTLSFIVAAGLDDANNDLWSQSSAGISGTVQANDGLGTSLAAADFDGDGDADLAIGVPSDDDAAADSGAVQVLRGVQTTGLGSGGDQYWDQDR